MRPLNDPSDLNIPFTEPLLLPQMLGTTRDTLFSPWDTPPRLSESNERKTSFPVLHKTAALSDWLLTALAHDPKQEVFLLNWPIIHNQDFSVPSSDGDCGQDQRSESRTNASSLRTQ